MTLLQTHRFLLRPIEQSDAPVFARLCNDELIARNTARIPYPYTLEDAEIFTKTAAAAFRHGKEYAFAVCEQDAVIACCGVMRITNILFELGYWVSLPARGRGVATEAAHAVSQRCANTATRRGVGASNTPLRRSRASRRSSFS